MWFGSPAGCGGELERFLVKAAAQGYCALEITAVPQP
jgi:hypothetical protein